MGKYDELKVACYESNLQLPRLGLVKFTFGNVSAADQSEKVFAIKPSGVPYDELRPADMVLVDFSGKVIHGKLNPSSDTQTHAVLYTEWHFITGIAHTHSTYAVAWAQAQKDIPILGTTHADYLPCDIPCAPVLDDNKIDADYEMETGNQIVKCFRDRNLSANEAEMVLVSNHGPFAWGNSAGKAVYHIAILEEIARMAWLTYRINPDAPRLKPSLVNKHFKRKHGDGAYYGQK
jgi:L-ribulose-5-phosphate 4-epimerase